MNNFIDLIRQIFAKKTIYRIMFNQMVFDNCREISGAVIDFAGGSNPSYGQYLPKNITITKTDYKKEKDIDLVLDLNKKLPVDDNSFDNALFFNAIYILENPEVSLSEMRRVIKNCGKLYIVSPFIANEMPEPDDYCRFTKQGLERIFKNIGFDNFKIIRFGGRFTSATYLLNPVIRFRILKILIYPMAIFFDWIIINVGKNKHPVPLGYFCILTK